VLSSSSLKALITDPALNLYPEERGKRPLEEIVEQVRTRDLHIQVMNIGRANGAAVTVLNLEFGYRDPQKAQAMLHAVSERLVRESKDSIQNTDWPGSELRQGVVEYLDYPSYPVGSQARFRVPDPLIGLAVGCLAGVVVLWRQRQSVVQRV
jgi:hypothetical protein